MKIIETFDLDPEEKMNFDISFADFLADCEDTILTPYSSANVLIEVEDGLTLEDFSVVDDRKTGMPNSVVRVWLKYPGSRDITGEFLVRARVKTNGGREPKGIVKVKVSE